MEKASLYDFGETGLGGVDVNVQVGEVCTALKLSSSPRPCSAGQTALLNHHTRSLDERMGTISHHKFLRIKCDITSRSDVSKQLCSRFPCLGMERGCDHNTKPSPHGLQVQDLPHRRFVNQWIGGDPSCFRGE